MSKTLPTCGGAYEAYESSKLLTSLGIVFYVTYSMYDMISGWASYFIYVSNCPAVCRNIPPRMMLSTRSGSQHGKLKLSLWTGLLRSLIWQGLSIPELSPSPLFILYCLTIFLQMISNVYVVFTMLYCQWDNLCLWHVFFWYGFILLCLAWLFHKKRWSVLFHRKKWTVCYLNTTSPAVPNRGLLTGDFIVAWDKLFQK